ncbi:MAG: hypothetical protein RL662_687 [Bacteroidota bacterium]|jgi:DNA-binding CsgD family transcriptional regulator
MKFRLIRGKIILTLCGFIYTIVWASAVLVANAHTGKPYSLNYTRSHYQASNQNWSASQDTKGVMYFANNAGLLVYDGIQWKLHQTPSKQVVLAVVAKDHAQIFTAGHQEFGRWDRNKQGILEYTSLSKQLPAKLPPNSHFWKIIVTTEAVYFQSFNSIYKYNYKEIRKIEVDTPLLFLSEARNQLWVQEMKGRLFRLIHDKLEPVEGSELFKGMDVRIILPYNDTQYLIGTAVNGVYKYDGNTFTQWNTAFTALMQEADLNSGIRTSQGTYFWGTLLKGIYVTDNDGRVLDQFSTSNVLKNNTILGLFEDNAHNVWATLDKGITYIKYMNNMSSHTDHTGYMGTIYDAQVWNNTLFVATNQGVFSMDQDKLSRDGGISNMKPLPSINGQTWTLSVIGNKLYAANNSGVIEIDQNNAAREPYRIGTGAFDIHSVTYKMRNIFLVSSYTGVQLIDKLTGTITTFKEIIAPIRNIEVDHLNNLWIEHAHNGAYKAKIKDDNSGLTDIRFYGGDSSDTLPYRLRLFKVGGRICMLGDGKFYSYDDITDTIVANDALNTCFENMQDVVFVKQIHNDYYWAISQSSIYKFRYDGYVAQIQERYDIATNNGVMLSEDPNIGIVNDSLNLICLDNGFLVYTSPQQSITSPQRTLPLPYLQSLLIRNLEQDNFEVLAADEELIVPHAFNSVEIQFFADNIIAQDLSFQYMLERVDTQWSPIAKQNKAYYPRLKAGRYTFWVRTTDNLGNFSQALRITFTVGSPWYASTWAYLIYLCLAIATSFATWYLIRRYYQRQDRRRWRKLEAEQLMVKNEQLQVEIDKKNSELLTQTWFMIQKNELILKLKTIVDNFYNKNKSQSLIPLQREINALLNNDLDTDTDWDKFLIKFEEKHAGFFKKLKTEYPDLTISDLRLCACLKLNLDTKQIASLLNLSIRGVENSRYRLRKKLQLDTNDNLNMFFVSIS